MSGEISGRLLRAGLKVVIEAKGALAVRASRRHGKETENSIPHRLGRASPGETIEALAVMKRTQDRWSTASRQQGAQRMGWRQQPRRNRRGRDGWEALVASDCEISGFGSL